MPSDTELVPISSSILSSYGGKPLLQVGEAGRAPRDVADALLALCTELPWLRITELFRTTATQALARKKYETWVAAGKPTGASFDAKTMKAAFVAKPGKSMHNGGRAIDVDVNTLKTAYGKEYLDAFWPVAAKHGFTPVIARPEEGKSESWHYDMRGCWDLVGDTHGYEIMGLCAALVVGQAGAWQGDVRLAQALLLRAGYDIGEPDGDFGTRSKGAFAATGIKWGPTTAEGLAALRALPAATTWKV